MLTPLEGVAVKPTYARQTINLFRRVMPATGQVVSHWTDRAFTVGGALNGVDTFASLNDAVTAARALSSGANPGLAVVRWRGGFRLHDVRTESRSWISTSPGGTLPSFTKMVKKSNVPFAIGNFRNPGGPHALPRVEDDHLVGFIDGSRTLDVTRGTAGDRLGTVVPGDLVP